MENTAGRTTRTRSLTSSIGRKYPESPSESRPAWADESIAIDPLSRTMANWMFRLSGEFPPGQGYVQELGLGSVTGAESSHGRKVLRFLELSDTAVMAEFSTASLFGYMTNPDGSIHVWPRVATPAVECQLKLKADVVRDGMFHGIPMVDLLHKDRDEPFGRFIAEWVLSYSHG
jgi:hypothetical protein